jgi:hypothetical protein
MLVPELVEVLTAGCSLVTRRTLPRRVRLQNAKGFHPSLKTMFSLKTSSPGFRPVAPLRDANWM